MHDFISGLRTILIFSETVRDTGKVVIERYPEFRDDFVECDEMNYTQRPLANIQHDVRMQK